MTSLTSVEAQNRFGELLDRAQREPVQVTRRGRLVAWVVSERDMEEIRDLRERRAAAAQWYARYRQQLQGLPAASKSAELSDDDVNRLVDELRG